jgi:hypothetical protein
VIFFSDIYVAFLKQNESEVLLIGKRKSHFARLPALCSHIEGREHFDDRLNQVLGLDFKSAYSLLTTAWRNVYRNAALGAGRPSHEQFGDAHAVLDCLDVPF